MKLAISYTCRLVYKYHLTTVIFHKKDTHIEFA